MSKRLLAIAIAAGLAAPLAAQAGDVSVYGVAHVSLNQIDVGATDGELDLTSNKSHFGIKGSRDLGDGLTGFFQTSWQVDYTDNTLNDPSTNPNPNTDLMVFDRWIGLKGSFGSVKAGTMASNYKQTGKIVDPFWATRAQMRDTGLMPAALLNGMDVHRSRITNAVQYTSNKINNMTFVLNTTLDGSGDKNTGLGVRYKNKNITAFFDYIKIDEIGSWAPAAKIATGESGMKVGGAYTMDATTIALGFDMTEDLLSNDYTQLSVTHKLNKKGTVALSYGQADSASGTSDKSGFVLGYKHKLGNQTGVYVAYLDQSNDVASTELSGFSTGMTYKF